MPSKQDRHHLNRYLAQIRAILLHEWDPIGIRAIADARNEYDSYAAEIHAILTLEEATKDAMAHRLHNIAIEQMGLSSSKMLDACCAYATERLMALRRAAETRPADPASTIRGFIAANLPVQAVPSIPEIRLHKAGPQSGLRRLAEQDPDFGSPYWAHYWGGGLALARYLLDRPETVVGQRVLDLGAGSGIVGIAAAKAGAMEVVAADVDPYAIAAIDLNAAINGATILPVLADITGSAPPLTDIICVGDLFYDADLAARVTAFLDRCLQQGIKVLIGDPWRAHLPHSRLRLLVEYSVADFGDAAERERPGAVFALEPARGGTDRS
ncbi:putative nicotinamide N-methyase [Rhizobium sp. BK602]|nr:putative nicotinamide N-methyase [Rhizobium sp. BK602]